MKYEVDKYTYRIEWSEEDEAYIARCLEFPSLAAHGYTQEEALKEIKIVVKESIEWLKEDKDFIPLPLSLRKYKGNLTLRVSPDIHKLLKIKSAEKGVSINQYINQIIESHINNLEISKKLNKIDEVIETLNEQISYITNIISNLISYYNSIQLETTNFIDFDKETYPKPYNYLELIQAISTFLRFNQKLMKKKKGEREDYVTDSSIGGIQV